MIVIEDLWALLRFVNVGLAASAIIGIVSVWISRRDETAPVSLESWAMMLLVFAGLYGTLESIIFAVPPGSRSLPVTAALAMTNAAIYLPMVFPFYWAWLQKRKHRKEQRVDSVGENIKEI